MALPSWLDVAQAHPTLRLSETRLLSVLSAVLAGEGRSCASLGVVLADRDTVLELNRTYLQHDYPTDVLSFLLEEPGDGDPVQGEIYVDLDTAAERHAEFASTFEDEALRYVVHGLLHLLGYDDATPAERAAMRRLEDRYLGAGGGG